MDIHFSMFSKSQSNKFLFHLCIQVETENIVEEYGTEYHVASIIISVSVKIREKWYAKSLVCAFPLTWRIILLDIFIYILWSFEHDKFSIRSISNVFINIHSSIDVFHVKILFYIKINQTHTARNSFQMYRKKKKTHPFENTILFFLFYGYRKSRWTERGTNTWRLGHSCWKVN